MSLARLKTHRRIENYASFNNMKEFVEFLAPWLDHKSWCASETQYHLDKITGEKVNEPCNCGLDKLRSLL